jgi:hypothetical protein
MKALFVLMLALSAAPAQAAWISLCRGDAPPESGRVLAEVMRPSGERRLLVLSSTRPTDCESREIALAEKQILAGRFVHERVVAESGKGVVLRGRELENGFVVSEIFPLATATADPVTAVAGVELLPAMEAVAFGVEPRAAVRREGINLVVDCSAGSLPAGAVLRLPSRGVPAGAAMTAVVDYSANAMFEFGIADSARAARGDPLLFATLAAALPRATAALPAARVDLATIEAWTLLCPLQAARLEVRSFRLETKPSLSPPPRALWAWQHSAWLDQPAALLDKLTAAGARTVFATVPVELAAARVNNATELRTFIAAATARGISVWAVAGDPQAVLPAGRTSFAARAAAFARYNRESPAVSRLAGVQYDIEPYLNAGYELDPAAWHQAYLETIRTLRREGGELKLDVAVPYWWSAERGANGGFLDTLATAIDSMTVMNYRTEPDAVRRSAQPFLEWGVRNKRAVRIALEAGPIPDEEDRTYLPEPRGEVLLLDAGGAGVLLLCDAPVTTAGARSFRFARKSRAPGSSITFHGDRQKLDALVRDLERQWAAWPAFAGIALHEY